MTLRLRLLLASTITLLLAVWLVAWVLYQQAKTGYEQLQRQRTAALLRQFEREYDRRSAELARNTEALATSDAVLQMAAELGGAQGDPALFVGEATTLATERSFDYLEFYDSTGLLISSFQRPARYGYRESWVPPEAGKPPFLHKEELLDSTALSLSCVRAVNAGTSPLYLLAGSQLDEAFANSLSLPEGARLVLYSNLQPELSAAHLHGSLPPQPEQLLSIVDRVRNGKQAIENAGTLADGESVALAKPLVGRSGQLLGVVLILSAQPELEALSRTAGRTALLGGLATLLLGIAVSSWATLRISRPLKRLAEQARSIGDTGSAAIVTQGSKDEIGQLSRTLTELSTQLGRQREQLVQAERVAAWRELARRLAHELKNPLFPLQLTVENLQRSRLLPPAEFDEIFVESTGLLQNELRHLKQIVEQFNDFAKMPAPQRQTLTLNEVVSEAAPLFQLRLEKSSVEFVIRLDPDPAQANADPELLHRVVQNLLLNALDAMPSGGTLTVETTHDHERVILTITDTGQGITAEEQQRLFTPYYTTKQHGTGLGLAIVQSVVSDHQGTIEVKSEPGKGTMFRIALPRSGSVETGEINGLHSVSG